MQHPNLFVIGAPKCGTTAVHAALDASPGVFMSPVKEPGFFNSDHNYAQGLDHYLRAYFAEAPHSQIVGESTPWYLYSSTAPGRIRDAFGSSVTIVILLRDPTARALSMFRDQVGVGSERRSFSEAMRTDLRAAQRTPSEPIGLPSYVRQGLYADHIDRWQSHFPDTTHVIQAPGTASTHTVWAQLGEALGSDLGPDRLSELTERQRNTAGRVRFAFALNAPTRIASHYPALRDGVRKVLPPGFDQRILQAARRAATRPASEPVAADPSTIRELDEFYAPQVDEVRHRWGFDLREPL